MQSEEIKIVLEEEKLIRLRKINLIYELKLKLNGIERNIRRKTCNLT